MRPLLFEECYDEEDDVPALTFLARLFLLAGEECDCGVIFPGRELLLSVPIIRDLVSLPISYMVSVASPTCKIFYLYAACYIVVKTLPCALPNSNTLFLEKRVAGESHH